MSFAKDSCAKCLTTTEIEEILQDPAFWEDMNNNDVDGEDIQISIIPPQPDELTDTDNFEENNLEGEEMKDVAGTLEVFVPDINDESELSSDDEPLAVKKRKLSKIKEKRAFEFDNKNNKSNFEKIAKTPPWINKIKYADANSPLENDFENVASLLYGKTVVDIFQDFFTDYYIIQQSTLYARQKNNQNFSLTAEDLRVFISVLLVSGYHKLPQEDMYRQQSPDAAIPLIYNALPRRRFKEIKKYIHLANNTLFDKEDKMYKVRPYFDMLK